MTADISSAMSTGQQPESGAPGADGAAAPGADGAVPYAVPGDGTAPAPDGPADSNGHAPRERADQDGTAEQDGVATHPADGAAPDLRRGQVAADHDGAAVPVDVGAFRVGQDGAADPVDVSSFGADQVGAPGPVHVGSSRVDQVGAPEPVRVESVRVDRDGAGSVDPDATGDAVPDYAGPGAGEPLRAGPTDAVDAEPVHAGPGDAVEPFGADPTAGAELVRGEPVPAGDAAGEPVEGRLDEDVVAAEVAGRLGAVVGDDVEADPAEFAAAAVLDVLRASGWADAAEAAELRAEAERTRELLNMVVRDHRAREASAAGTENQQLYWLVPLLRAAHGVAFGSLGAKVALRTAVQDVPPEILAQAGLRIDYGVEHNPAED